MRSRAFRVECVDQPFEGQIGVLERAEVAFANLGEDVLERRVGRDLCSQHESVDEHTDQVIEFGLAAAGDGCPDGDVLGTGQARRKYRQCCVHEHEHGGAVLTCQVGQRPMGLRRYREPVDRADHGRLCRTWERRRQRDRLAQSRESVLPVIELTGQSRVRIFLGAEHFVLPHSEVAVLHGQFRPVRRTAGTAGRVSRCHVRCEGVHREPVGDDVVDDDHEYVPALVPVDAQDRAADRNFGRGVEACRGQLEDSIGHSGSSDDFRLQDRHDFVAGHHLLNRLSVDRGELRPQALVAPQYVRYRGLQCGEVQIAVEAHCQGNVVGGGRHVELVEEPHPLLCQ